MISDNIDFILASKSPRRAQLLKEIGIHPAIAIIHKVVSDLDIKGTEKKIFTNTVAQTKHLVNIVFSSSLLLKYTTDKVIIVWGRSAFIDALLVS